MTSLMYSIFRSVCNVWLFTYQGVFVIIPSTFDWLLWIIDILQRTYETEPLNKESSSPSDDRI
jgi:hypothetical protein